MLIASNINSFDAQRLTIVGQQLDGFHRLQGTDSADQRRHHARFDAGEGAVAEQPAQAAVAGLARLIGEHAELAFHADRRAGNQRPLLRVAQAVQGVARRHVVGAVQHQITGGDLCRNRLIFQTAVDRVDADMWIDGAQFLPGGGDFAHADAIVAVQDLALQVGERDGVEIHQYQMADAGRRQVRRGGAAQPAQPGDQHAGGLQLLLAVEVKAAQHDLAVVAQRFGVGQFR